MISVVIATLNSETALLPTLAALVPGAVDGVISEVIVVDGGSRDDTAVVADAAGCTLLPLEGSPGRRLRGGAAAARAPHLLFLRPGTVLEPPWIAAVRAFVERRSNEAAAAAFRRSLPAGPAWRAAWSLIAQAWTALPRPEQGVLIARRFYDALGGHGEGNGDAESDLIRRIGRRRIVMLSARVATAAA